MKSSTKGILIGISIVTIAVGFFAIYRGKGWEDALPSFVIGFSLLGTAFIEGRKQSKDAE